MSATRTVWELAGSPTPTGASAATMQDARGTCAVCGHASDRTADVNRALGANFTDRSMYADQSSTRVCPACLWCCSGKPPATLRMWSIIAAPGHGLGPSHEKAWLQDTPGLLLTNRANPKPISDWLAYPPETPWICSIAVSGQKHVLPYARVNYGRERWTVRYENTNVTATPTEWANVHASAWRLRKMGVPADDVLTGAPRYLKTADDLSEWRHHDSQLEKHHNSPLLELALWTITKGTLT